MAFEYLSTPWKKPGNLPKALQAGLSYKTETIQTSSALGRVAANAVYARSVLHTGLRDGRIAGGEADFGASETTPARLSEDDLCG